MIKTTIAFYTFCLFLEAKPATKRQIIITKSSPLGLSNTNSFTKEKLIPNAAKKIKRELIGVFLLILVDFIMSSFFDYDS